MSAVLDFLPRGNTLSDEVWKRRHKLLQLLLAGHLPALFAFGLIRGYALLDVAETLALPLACLVLGHLMRSRRPAAAFITLGLASCSAALVGFSDGAIEAHFHFFIIIGFIALYQDWVPFLLNILFTVLSHGIGSSFVPDLMFNHRSAQDNPWGWSLLHGVAVLAACVGVVLFWKTTEEEQTRSVQLTKRLADAEIGQRRFTSDLLVNLARRNQNLLYRQLELLNQLEDKERDPDALADLFRLDHLATRIRRNAESLLVLSGEESPRTWREPVALVDVVRAAIAEIEDLDRVDYVVDETLSVAGRSVADLTHMFAELLENAVHFSPPNVTVMLRSRPLPSSPGTQLITVEDWGVGMTPKEMSDANMLLQAPREVDLSVSQRLGLHVVARLAQRYGIRVELTGTPGGGVTAVAVLPPAVFAAPGGELVGAGAPVPVGAGARGAGGPMSLGPTPSRTSGPAQDTTPSRSAGSPFDALPSRTAGSSLGGIPSRDGAPSLGGPSRDPAPSLGGSSRDGAPSLGGSSRDGAPPLGGPSRDGASPLGGPSRDGAPPLGGPSRDGASSPGRGASRAGGPSLAGAFGGQPPAAFAPAPANGDRPRGDRPGLADLPTPPRPADGTRTAGDLSTGPGNGRTPAGPAGPAGLAPPTRPRPGLPGPGTPGPAGSSGAGQLPRRGPGEALARTRSFGGVTPAPFTDMSDTDGPGGRPGPRAGGAWSSWWDRPPQTDGGTPGDGAQARPGGPSGSRAVGGSADGGSAGGSPEPDRNGAEPQPATPPVEPRLPEPRPPVDEGPQLRRRVPQANLAAGLRRDQEPTHDQEGAAAVRDPMATRNALSRFQAAQRQAREQVEGGPDGGTDR